MPGHRERLKDSLWELVLSIHPLGSRYQTQGTMLVTGTLMHRDIFLVQPVLCCLFACVSFCCLTQDLMVDLSNLLPVASPCPGTNFLILSYLWSSIPAVFLPASSAIPRSRISMPNCWGWPAAVMSRFKPGRQPGAEREEGT